MSIVENFRWEQLDDEQFEELLYGILAAARPEHIEWRKGPADQGRDVQAMYRRFGAFGEAVDEHYFAEAKHYHGGVPPVAISGALAWAHAEQPDVLILAVSSHVTTACRDHVSRWSANNPQVRVLIWERREIENKVLEHQIVREQAVKLGLLPPSIHDLLPSSPEALRAYPDDESGFAMEYRYWITEEEVEKLGYVVDLIERLETVLFEHLPEGAHIGDLAVATSNWTTFLVLLRAQLRLQIAIRDYLFALSSGSKDTELRELNDRVKRYVEEVNRIGDSSYHID